jgi:hypothetical protein
MTNSKNVSSTYKGASPGARGRPLCRPRRAARPSQAPNRPRLRFTLEGRFAPPCCQPDARPGDRRRGRRAVAQVENLLGFGGEVLKRADPVFAEGADRLMAFASVSRPHGRASCSDAGPPGPRSSQVPTALIASLGEPHAHGANSEDGVSRFARGLTCAQPTPASVVEATCRGKR